jgi:hypothetical protein
MSRLIKRQRKRIIKRKLRFVRSPKGAVYCKAGCVIGFYDPSYFYVVIRNGHTLQWKKVYHYGTQVKIPKWVTSSLQRKGCVEELTLLNELRKWIENGPHTDPTEIL